MLWSIDHCLRFSLHACANTLNIHTTTNSVTRSSVTFGEFHFSLIAKSDNKMESSVQTVSIASIIIGGGEVVGQLHVMAIYGKLLKCSQSLYFPHFTIAKSRNKSSVKGEYSRINYN